MREKFRVWDGSKGKMIYKFFLDASGRIYFDSDPHGVDMSGKIQIYSPPNENHLILMECTGLPDKHGKEIWTGDKVKQYYTVNSGTGSGGYEYESIEFHRIGEVVILPSTGVCLKNPTHYEEGEAPYVIKGYYVIRGYRSEIIGNIYEEAT